MSSFRRTGFLKAASCGLQKHFFRLRPPPRRSGRRVAEAGEGLSRLYASIEAGTIDGTDPMLKERVAALKATRDRALEALDYAKKSSALPIEVDPVAVDLCVPKT